MTSTLAKALGAAVMCLTLAGCNTAAPLPSDEETATLGPARCPSGAIIGTGSPLHRTAFEEVLAAYGERCDSRSSVEFNAASAEAALTAFTTTKADWLSVDAPLNQAQNNAAAAHCAPHQPLTLPMLANPVALAYQLPGVDRLVLTGPVAGRIFDGSIASWDHPEIAALNPGVRLPGAPIAVFGRADPSATTAQLSAYLAAAGGWPPERVGQDWAGTGAKQSETSGMIRALRATPFSIGYAEFSAARDNSLPVAWLDSGTGPVELTSRSAAQALTDATVTGSGGELRITPQYASPGAGSYPILSVGYQLVCSAGLARGKAPVLRDFFGFLVSDQQQQSLGELGLAPLPETVRAQVTDAIARIR